MSALVNSTIARIHAGLDELREFSNAPQARRRLHTSKSVRNEIERLMKAFRIMLNKASKSLDRQAFEHDIQILLKVEKLLNTAYDKNDSKELEKANKALSQLIFNESERVKQLFFVGPQIV